MCFCDVNETLGSKTLQELQSKYGDRNVMFQVCDVTKQQQMESKFCIMLDNDDNVIELDSINQKKK